MDARRFDRLVASLFVAGSRRGLLRWVAALPLGGALAVFVADDGEAGREAGRDAVSAQGRMGKRKKRCRPNSVARTCAGKCGTVRNNCRKQVNCGACACPACGVCQTCDAASGQCVTAANRTRCGDADGRCCNGVCCDGCCRGNGSCGPCLAFTTSSTHTGNLGGLAGADVICQRRAGDLRTPLPGSYKAWLSIGTGDGESPSSRFRQSALGYVRTDGVSVADSFADLVDGAINHPIYAMEDGSPVPPPNGQVNIWTNTGADGAEFSDEPNDPFDCDNWRSANSSLNGRIGMADPIVTGKEWTELGSVQSCDFPNARLYCFQQE
jgi:hypothetical protein